MFKLRCFYPYINNVYVISHIRLGGHCLSILCSKNFNIKHYAQDFLPVSFIPAILTGTI